MRKELLVALRVTAVTLVLTGLIYPLVTTGLAQVLFPHRAAGSFVTDESGRVVGSELIGQGFSAPGYFHPRPSAAGKDGWDADRLHRIQPRADQQEAPRRGGGRAAEAPGGESRSPGPASGGAGHRLGQRTRSRICPPPELCGRFPVWRGRGT